MNNERVLIVEDNPELYELYEGELIYMNFNQDQILVCDSLEKGIKGMKEFNPTIALVDNWLQKDRAAESPELSKILKESNTAAYLITGSWFDSDFEKQMVMKFGFTGVLSKPFSFDKIFNMAKEDRDKRLRSTLRIIK